MDRLHDFTPLRSGCHVGVIGDHDDSKPAPSEPLERHYGPREDLHFFEGGRRMGPTFPYQGAEDHAVAVNEDATIQACAHSLLSSFSHAASWIMRLGWQTRLCQTTAWNASV